MSHAEVGTPDHQYSSPGRKTSAEVGTPGRHESRRTWYGRRDRDESSKTQRRNGYAHRNLEKRGMDKSVDCESYPRRTGYAESAETGTSGADVGTLYAETGTFSAESGTGSL